MALAQENIKRFEVDEVTLQNIAAAIALDTNADEPGRLRDVIGLEDENVRLICGHALINRAFMSAGYRPFNGTVSEDGSFKLVNYNYPINFFRHEVFSAMRAVWLSALSWVGRD